MKNFLICFFILTTSTNVISQIAVTHKGVSVFANENYLGAHKNEKNGQAVQAGFVIKSLRLWPGYEAYLSSSITGLNIRFTEDSPVILSSHDYDIVTAVPGGSNIGPFVAMAYGGSNGKMVAYLTEGTHELQVKLGGAISSITTDPSYSSTITGSTTVDVAPLSYPMLFSEFHFKGQTQPLNNKNLSAQSLNFDVKSVAIPPGGQFTVEISGVNAGSVYTKTFYTNINNLNKELKTITSGYTRPPVTYITNISQ